MKKILNLIVFLIFVNISFLALSQRIISVEEAGAQIIGNGIADDVTEINDINNFFEPYVGSWRAVHDNKEYVINIYRERKSLASINLTVDDMGFSYSIKNNSTGAVLADSSNIALGDAYGKYYEPTLDYYKFTMSLSCGESLTVNLGFESQLMMPPGVDRYDRLIFLSHKSVLNQDAGNGCQSYIHLLPDDEGLVFERI